jgi:pyruvate/2-oxoglutarate/acetoin dehydrogenase E1 component
MSPTADTVLSSLNQALHYVFEQNERVLLLGEDILDPYGGAFKVSQGLSSAFPSRVITTPISEAGIVGLATGLALRGFRPVVEIMFGDFLTLSTDQIINHLSKFRWMYNDQVRVPMVIRTPMGGRRGYGPTHSQTLEKHFLGIPGLQILAANNMVNPGNLLARTILKTEDPVLFIENKSLYRLPIFDSVINGFELTNQVEIVLPYETPTSRLTIAGAPTPRLTMTAYGYMAELARHAMHILAYEDEIFCELIVPTSLSPLCTRSLLESVAQTGILLSIEEGTATLGWGAEVLARVSENLGNRIRHVRRLAAQEHPIPASPNLEKQTLPGVPDIVAVARDLISKDIP